MLAGNEAPIWLNQGEIGLDLLFDEATYDQMEKAVRNLLETKKEEQQK